MTNPHFCNQQKGTHPWTINCKPMPSSTWGPDGRRSHRERCRSCRSGSRRSCGSFNIVDHTFHGTDQVQPPDKREVVGSSFVNDVVNTHRSVSRLRLRRMLVRQQRPAPKGRANEPCGNYTTTPIAPGPKGAGVRGADVAGTRVGGAVAGYTSHEALRRSSGDRQGVQPQGRLYSYGHGSSNGQGMYTPSRITQNPPQMEWIKTMRRRQPAPAGAVADDVGGAVVDGAGVVGAVVFESQERFKSQAATRRADAAGEGGLKKA